MCARRAAPSIPPGWFTSNDSIWVLARIASTKPLALSNGRTSRSRRRRRKLARGGRSLTSEQRANASPEARQAIDRNDRAAAAREVGARTRDQGMRRSPPDPAPAEQAAVHGKEQVQK